MSNTLQATQTAASRHIPPRAQGQADHSEPGAETWSALAEWLRHMRAQASRLPRDVAEATSPQTSPVLAQAETPARSKRRIKFVWNRRFIGLIVD